MEGTPKQYTNEEIAEMEKSRTISDGNLLEGGAEYVVNDKGGLDFVATPDQKRLISYSENEEIYYAKKRRAKERVEFFIKDQNIHKGDVVKVNDGQIGRFVEFKNEKVFLMSLFGGPGALYEITYDAKQIVSLKKFDYEKFKEDERKKRLNLGI